MLLSNCMMKNQEAVEVGNGAEVTKAVRLALCRQYELALFIRGGKQSPSQVREAEKALRDGLHRLFTALKWVEEKPAPSSRCDICLLAELVRRMALSEYSLECRDVIVHTKGDAPERAEFDLAAALREYARDARLDANSWAGSRVARAISILRELQNPVTEFRVIKQEAESEAILPDLEPTAINGFVRLAREQIMTIRSSYLRLIPERHDVFFRGDSRFWPT